MAVAVVLLLSSATIQDAAKNRIEVRVDPRVELMSLIFRLAGSSEYNQPNSKSPYSETKVHCQMPTMPSSARLLPENVSARSVAIIDFFMLSPTCMVVEITLVCG